jgi:hypothetical protein
MNFYQAPIARFIRLVARDTASVAVPVVPGTGVYPASTGQALGRNVTVFFETPGWPTASHKVEVKGQTTGTPNNLVAAPNVCLSDADSYIFLRGNSVYANNATASLGIHVVYSATLENVQPSTTRAASSNNYWVRPGDTFTFTNPVQAASVGSNIGDAAGFTSVAVVTSVRQKGGPDRLVIEFSVPIVTTAVLGYRTGTSGNWPAYDLVFFAGASPGAATNPVGLSFNRLQVQVSSASNWTAALSAAVNLSYPTANPAGLFVPDPSGSDPKPAGLINPSSTLITSSAALAANGRQMYVQLDGGTPATRYNCNYTFEHRPDFNQGSAPYRCISFTAAGSSDWSIEVLVHPLH